LPVKPGSPQPASGPDNAPKNPILTVSTARTLPADSIIEVAVNTDITIFNIDRFTIFIAHLPPELHCIINLSYLTPTITLHLEQQK
jgi:hypothetical protein